MALTFSSCTKQAKNLPAKPWWICPARRELVFLVLICQAMKKSSHPVESCYNDISKLRGEPAKRKEKKTSLYMLMYFISNFHSSDID